MEKSVGFIGGFLPFRDDVLITLFQLHPDIRKNICRPSEVIGCFMKGLVSQLGAHHGDQYHEIPVLLCPLFQTVNAVGVPEIVDSGAVPGMGDAGLPEKAPEVFIDIPQCHRLFTVTWEKIS